MIVLGVTENTSSSRDTFRILTNLLRYEKLSI